jgi:hypothetical protein
MSGVPVIRVVRVVVAKRGGATSPRVQFVSAVGRVIPMKPDPSLSTEPKGLDPKPWKTVALDRPPYYQQVFDPRPEYSQDLSAYENGAK